MQLVLQEKKVKKYFDKIAFLQISPLFSPALCGLHIFGEDGAGDGLVYRESNYLAVK